MCVGTGTKIHSFDGAGPYVDSRPVRDLGVRDLNRALCLLLSRYGRPAVTWSSTITILSYVAKTTYLGI